MILDSVKSFMIDRESHRDCIARVMFIFNTGSSKNTYELNSTIGITEKQLAHDLRQLADYIDRTTT